MSELCLSYMTTTAAAAHSAAGGGDRGPLAVFNLERVGIQQVDFGWRLGRYLSSIVV